LSRLSSFQKFSFRRLLDTHTRTHARIIRIAALCYRGNRTYHFTWSSGTTNGLSRVSNWYRLTSVRTMWTYEQIYRYACTCVIVRITTTLSRRCTLAHDRRKRGLALIIRARGVELFLSFLVPILTRVHNTLPAIIMRTTVASDRARKRLLLRRIRFGNRSEGNYDDFFARQCNGFSFARFRNIADERRTRLENRCRALSIFKGNHAFVVRK